MTGREPQGLLLAEEAKEAGVQRGHTWGAQHDDSSLTVGDMWPRVVLLTYAAILATLSGWVRPSGKNKTLA